MADITPQERFRGCLLAGAAGDALGAPVEFMPRADILRHFGTAGITAFALGYERVGAITDDTQMTLFTAAGLLAAWCGDGDVVRATARSYLAWLRTQDEWPYDPLLAAEEPSGWLWQQPELHHRRAPGMTCLTALRGMPVLGALAQNNSKGCGGVMRMAPVGLYAAAQRWSHAQTFQTGTALATLTHGHPAGSLTAGVLAVLVQALCEEATLADGLARAKPLLRARAGHESTLHLLQQAEALAASDVPPALAVAQLGQGWIAEEALAIAVYCTLAAADVRSGIVMAVNHDGDSDSTGAIAGNLLGARDGINAIPGEWLKELELRTVIDEVATDLYATGDSDNNDARMREKYPS